MDAICAVYMAGNTVALENTVTVGSEVVVFVGDA